jgi:hypothetical protein
VNFIPLFDRSRPFLRPDLPIGRAPRTDAVQDALWHRRSRREASWTASSTALVSVIKGPAPYVVSALNLAKNRFSAFAALQGVR